MKKHISIIGEVVLSGVVMEDVPLDKDLHTDPEVAAGTFNYTIL